MKRKILCGIVALAVAGVATWNVNYNSQKNEMSDIMLANIEALAESEFDPIASCNLWCKYDPEYICILYTNVGINIYCYGMKPWLP